MLLYSQNRVVWEDWIGEYFSLVALLIAVVKLVCLLLSNGHCSRLFYVPAFIFADVAFRPYQNVAELVQTYFMLHTYIIYFCYIHILHTCRTYI